MQRRHRRAVANGEARLLIATMYFSVMPQKTQVIGSAAWVEVIGFVHRSNRKLARRDVDLIDRAGILADAPIARQGQVERVQ